jgi:hypothetical protein
MYNMVTAGYHHPPQPTNKQTTMVVVETRWKLVGIWYHFGFVFYVFVFF